MPGLVIRYSYLWQCDYRSGKEEGVKDRPCAIILVTKENNGDDVVTVLPVTHTPPSNPALALEIPALTKKRLGLDSERSWAVLTEANQFVWPGPDLRPVSNDPGAIAYGLLPEMFFNQLRAKFIAILRTGHASLARRTE